MASQKALSLRIRSVKSIQKTTRVMQMISASKFRVARNNLASAREYCAKLGGEACNSTRGKIVLENAKGRLIVVFSSDRGLCGGYNYSIAKYLREHMGSLSEKDVSFLFVGKKAYDSVRSTVESYGKVLAVVPQPKGMSFLSFKGFLYSLGIDFWSFSKVSVLYSKFNTINDHEQIVEDILSISNPDDLEYSAEGDEKDGIGDELCSYDPSLSEIQKMLWMQDFMGRFYLALCNSVTCEHCCRMISMESANTNTQSMLERLVLDYNRSRQASITTDLIEVVSGCEALG
ncbi:F0F1 ATP synthase subunit gamma [Anaplasma platys]|nr:FoF1 ATP synthase subunit gamma [Anaplasma platys]